MNKAVKKKAELKKRAQAYFNSVVEEPIDGFDNFFVGDQAEDLMNRSLNRNVHNFQGIAYKGSEVEMVDDLEDFEFDTVAVTNEDLLEIFYDVKREVFEMFDFVNLKSKKLNHPVRERDLVVNEDDYHLVAYLTTMKVDKNSAVSVAKLVAFRELGFIEAKFINTCACPLCEAFDGKIFNINEALEILCSGRMLIHKSCDCDWVPVIDRFKKWPFRIDEAKWGIYGTMCVWYNVPIELKEQLLEFSSKIFVLNFVDMNKVIEEYDIDTSSGFPVVLKFKNNDVCVHNNYINGLGPVEFLKSYIEKQELNEDSNKEIFLFKGRKVYSRNGFYVDVETGETV